MSSDKVIRSSAPVALVSSLLARNLKGSVTVAASPARAGACIPVLVASYMRSLMFLYVVLAYE